MTCQTPAQRCIPARISQSDPAAHSPESSIHNLETVPTQWSVIGLQWSSIPHCSLPYSAMLLCVASRQLFSVPGCDTAPASQVCASAAEGPLGPGDRGTGRSLHAVHVVALALASLAAAGAPHVPQLAAPAYFLVLVSVISAVSSHAIIDWSVLVAPGGMK